MSMIAKVVETKPGNTDSVVKAKLKIVSVGDAFGCDVFDIDSRSLWFGRRDNPEPGTLYRIKVIWAGYCQILEKVGQVQENENA